jgi:uncharacterized damage-inducible protein DinB
MNTATQLATHFRQVYTGGNWTWVNLKDTLNDISWQQATTKVYGCNTIVALTYHIGYYVTAITNVLNGAPLEAHDKYSFDHPPVNSQQDWEQLVNKTLQDAETYIKMAGQLPDEKLPETFVLEKYGNYHRNLLGLIEHTHYHLGQIVILKKVIGQMEAP